MMHSTCVFLFVALVLITSSSCATYSCDSNSQCGCSSVSSATLNARIVGGELASNSTWGWTVSLQLDAKHRCGASLLSAEYAVTAGHCVNTYLSNPQALSIVVGTNYLSDTSSTVQRRTVTGIRIYPSFIAATNVNDIALLHFDTLTTGAGSKLSFICLPQARQDPYSVGTNLVAIGWGVLFSGSPSVPDALRQVTLQVLSPSAQSCSTALSGNDLVKFCAGYEDGGKGKSSSMFMPIISSSSLLDTCQGDSGGPLMAFVNGVWVLAGITSSGTGCALSGFPGLYTRVSAYITFINSVLTGGQIETIPPVTTTTTTTSPSTVASDGKLLSHSLFVLLFFSLVVLIFQ